MKTITRIALLLSLTMMVSGQTQTRCEQTLSMTWATDHKTMKSDNVYTTTTVLQVPVEANPWIAPISNGDAIVFVIGTGTSTNRQFARDKADMDARRNAACAVVSEEVQRLYIVDGPKVPVTQKPNFFQTILNKVKGV